MTLLDIATIDRTGKTDVTAQWQAAVNAVSLAGGGRVNVPPGRYQVKRLQIADNVKLVGEGSRASVFVAPYGETAIAAVPKSLWTDQKPCDSAGLMFDANNHCFVWDSIEIDRPVLDGSLSFGLSFRWDGGPGYIVTYGGALTSDDENEGHGALLAFLYVNAAGYLSLSTRSMSDSGIFLKKGIPVEIQCQISSAGVPSLIVAGKSADTTVGKPVPLPPRKPWYSFVIGGRQFKYGDFQTNERTTGRVAWAELRSSDGLSRADFTKADGPFIPMSTGGSIPIIPGADAQGPQGWGLENIGIEAPYGRALWMSNVTQQWSVRGVMVKNCRVGIVCEKNVYEGVMDDLFIDCEHTSLRLWHNGGQFPIRGIRMNAGKFGITICNSYGVHLDYVWCNRVYAGGVVLHAHIPGCKVVVNDFNWFDENGTDHYAGCVATGDANSLLVMRDSIFRRQTPGPSGIEEGCQVISDNLTLPNRFRKTLAQR